MSRVADESAVVLHVRPFRETSLLVDLLSFRHGRLSAVARGARGKRLGSPVQPFNRLRVGWFGRGTLVTLNGIELEAQPVLKGDSLAAGFYLIELVLRLIGEGENVPRVFTGFCWAVEQLAIDNDRLAGALRAFEKLLLEELGYGLDFNHEAETGAPISAAGQYRLEPGVGFVALAANLADGERTALSGAGLLQIGAGQFEQAAARRIAKRIFRAALAPHLGPKPLISRRLLNRGRIR